VYVDYAEEIRSRHPVQKYGQRAAHKVLWEIEVRCAHGSCELTTPIYTSYHEADTASEVIDIVLHVDPILDCQNHAHSLKLRKERIKANPLVF
jgi:hypothetical protein